MVSFIYSSLFFTILKIKDIKNIKYYKFNTHRSEIQIIDINQQFDFLETQSQNELAKMALIVLKLHEKFFGKSVNWHKSLVYSLQVSQVRFGFSANNFFFKTTGTIVQMLTSTGIMDHIIQSTCYNIHQIVFHEKQQPLM